jgi:hypothetical protein
MSAHQNIQPAWWASQGKIKHFLTIVFRKLSKTFLQIVTKWQQTFRGNLTIVQFFSKPKFPSLFGQTFCWKNSNFYFYFFLDCLSAKFITKKTFLPIGINDNEWTYLLRKVVRLFSHIKISQTKGGGQLWFCYHRKALNEWRWFHNVVYTTNVEVIKFCIFSFNENQE